MSPLFQDVTREIRNTIAPLLGGIVEDAQTLVRQEMRLAKSEIREEVSKAKGAALSFGAGAVVGLVAAVMLCLTVAHFLVWMFPDLPIWGSYGIVTLLLGCVTAYLFVHGQKQAADVDMVPHQTVETLKENAAWAKSKIQ